MIDLTIEELEIIKGDIILVAQEVPYGADNAKRLLIVAKLNAAIKQGKKICNTCDYYEEFEHDGLCWLYRSIPRNMKNNDFCSTWKARQPREDKPKTCGECAHYKQSNIDNEGHCMKNKPFGVGKTDNACDNWEAREGEKK